MQRLLAALYEGLGAGRGAWPLTRPAPCLRPPPLGSVGRALAGQEAQVRIPTAPSTDSGPWAVTSLSVPRSEMGRLGWKQPQPPPESAPALPTTPPQE